MHNYSSTKLELLGLKWAVMEKFLYYLFDSQFQFYADNNLPAYIQDSKLGTSQIWWLSELVLFNFTIRYQTGHWNRAADALSCFPFNPSCDFKSKTDSNEVEVISDSLVCEAIDQCLNSSKIAEGLKQEAQNISCVVQPIIEEEDKDENFSTLNAVSLFERVTPEKMMEEWQKDPILKLVYQQVTAGKKPKTSAFAKIKSEAPSTGASSVTQWPRSSGNRMNSCLMSGEILLEHHVLRCHKLCEKCPQCQTVKGDYGDPKTKPGSIITHLINYL